MLLYSSSLGPLAYLTKVLLLYAAVQDQESFVSRDGETTLNYPGGFSALLRWPVNYKLTIEPLTKEVGRVSIARHLHTGVHNKETVAMLVSKTNPLGIELFPYVNTSFCSINLHGCWCLAT